MKHNIIALLFCLISFAASAQDGKQKDQYLGLDKSAVIQKLGPPSITQKEAGDGEKLIYISKKTNTAGAASAQATPEPKEERLHMYSFTLDKNGKVTDWKESYSQSK